MIIIFVSHFTRNDINYVTRQIWVNASHELRDQVIWPQISEARQTVGIFYRTYSILTRLRKRIIIKQLNPMFYLPGCIFYGYTGGIILCMRPANDRRCYKQRRLSLAGRFNRRIPDAMASSLLPKKYSTPICAADQSIRSESSLWYIKVQDKVSVFASWPMAPYQ